MAVVAVGIKKNHGDFVLDIVPVIFVKVVYL